MEEAETASVNCKSEVKKVFGRKLKNFKSFYQCYLSEIKSIHMLSNIFKCIFESGSISDSSEKVLKI